MGGGWSGADDSFFLLVRVGVEDDSKFCNLIVPNEMWQFRHDKTASHEFRALKKDDMTFI